MNRLKKALQVYLSNLYAGYRLIVGRRPVIEDFYVSIGQILLLVLTVFSLEILLSYSNISTPASFNSYAVNYYFAIMFLEIVMIYFIALLIGEHKFNINHFLLINFSISPVLIFLKYSFDLLPQDESFSYWLNLGTYGLFAIWNLIIIYWILNLLFNTSTLKKASITLLYFCLLVGSAYSLPESKFWYSTQKKEYSAAYKKLYNLNVEEVFYSQFRLMTDSTNAIKEHTPGQTDLYLLAFGGYGLENVFLKEVEYVQTFFDEKFNTKDKSLVLVNNADTVDKYPMANYSNMYYGLSKISTKLDPEEDILFLFMTSHGSKNHKLSVRYGPIKLNNLTPSMIRETLDKSGIKWRIIVVSSCYSGGFIDELKDPNSLIITAAAKDKQSFGCGAESEFTDFGTAYFKYALKQETNFINAFYLAKNWIKEKETKEQLEPSLPQFFVGKNIKNKLNNLNAQNKKIHTNLKLSKR